MMNPVVWFEIYVRDMPRAVAFYEAVLDRKLERMAAPADELEMWTFPSLAEPGPGASGALVKMDGFGPAAGGTLVYFSCQDCAVEASRAAGSGGSIVKPKFAIGPYGFCALVTDTEGNMVGLHSMA